MIEKDYYLWFCSINELELVEKFRLIKFFHTPEQIWHTTEKNMYEAGISQKVISIITEKRKNFILEKTLDVMYKNNINFTAIIDNTYPEKLKNIDFPPIGLFYKGKLPKADIPSVAVIGSRTCSDYGRKITSILVKDIAGVGVQIISGLAMGIDGCAHEAALNVSGDTFGILGTGIDKIYPAENRTIFEKMYETGGVISEYFMGTIGLRNHFPERNRIIAGLSDCVIVVEARKKSGTMITTDKALEQGKEVFVVPGRIGDALSEGCLNLAKQGAEIILSADDIAFSLREKFPDWISYNTNNDGQYTFKNKNNHDNFIKNCIRNKNILENEERIVYALLSFKPKHFEELVVESGLDYFTIMNSIHSLCEMGLATEDSPEYYIRNK